MFIRSFFCFSLRPPLDSGGYLNVLILVLVVFRPPLDSGGYLNVLILVLVAAPVTAWIFLSALPASRRLLQLRTSHALLVFRPPLDSGGYAGGNDEVGSPWLRHSNSLHPLLLMHPQRIHSHPNNGSKPA